MQLRPRPGEKEELPRSELGNGHLSKHSPPRGQHVTNISQAHL